MKKYKTGILVGKFFPLQEGHLQSFNIIADLCEKVYFVFYYNAEVEEKLKLELDYDIDRRIEDTKLVLAGRNVEVVKFILPDGLTFPDDYLEIKRLLFKQIGVQSIDLQIFGEDDLEKYGKYIYADEYIVGPNIYKDGVAMHATLIRREYDKYKFLLHPIVRKRLDNKLNKQKFICVVGKSGSGKSSISRYLENKLDNSICIDIDKVVHKSHYDFLVKEKIIDIVGDSILDEDNNIDRKKLGNIVFNNSNLKDKVYDVTWEYIDNYIKGIMKDNYNYIILDWYNINTKSYWDIGTVKILTDRDPVSRKNEVMKRDNISSEYYDLREKNSNNYQVLVYDYKIDFSNLCVLDNIIDFLNR